MIKRSTTRGVSFITGINPYSAGSVLAECGKTKIHVTASIEESVPPFLKGQKKGWITAEYAMLPGSTHERCRRERGNLKGRTMEIQRLIGRALRSVVDFKKLGERSILLDCDVLVADGGTRTLSLSAGFIALDMAVHQLMKNRLITESPINDTVAAISVGIDREGMVMADIDYSEDSTCSTDMNIVKTASGQIVEIQGTAEREPFSREQLDAMLDCADKAIEEVFIAQKKVLSQWN